VHARGSRLCDVGESVSGWDPGRKKQSTNASIHLLRCLFRFIPSSDFFLFLVATSTAFSASALTASAFYFSIFCSAPPPNICVAAAARAATRGSFAGTDMLTPLNKPL
jgi:hypothetical protein